DIAEAGELRANGEADGMADHAREDIADLDRRAGPKIKPDAERARSGRALIHNVRAYAENLSADLRGRAASQFDHRQIGLRVGRRQNSERCLNYPDVVGLVGLRDAVVIIDDRS